MLHRRSALCAITAVLLFTTVLPGGLGAQVSGQAYAPRLALKGYDPVAYFTEGQPIPGKPEFEHTWDEARYRFASAENMTLFRSEPDRYAPQFAGTCAGGLSMGVKAEADPEQWLIHDGRLFVFSSSEAQAHFAANPQETAAAGGANWQALKGAPIGAKVAQ